MATIQETQRKVRLAQPVIRQRMQRAISAGVMALAACRNVADRSIALRCDQVASETDTTCTVYGPSLIALIATPDRYDHKFVRVHGFAVLEFEGNALYIGQEAFQHGMTESAVWINVPDSLRPADSTMWRGFYQVEGRFLAGPRGHLGMFSGTIDSITWFGPMGSRGEPGTGPSGFKTIVPDTMIRERPPRKP